MTMYRIIPCLLLKDDGLVKTHKFSKPQYIGDPINTVKIFNEKEVDELMFLDITATVNGKKPNLELIRDIAGESFMPIGYGGGITTIEEMKEIFHAGVEKVVLNAAAFENPELVEKAAAQFGSQSIVVSIDIKKDWLGRYEVCLHGGTKKTGVNPVEYTIQMQRRGAGELLINSIDRDSVMQGYDIDLIKKISSAVEIPVVALGGAGRFEDFDDAVKNGGASAVGAGSMFVFYGEHKAVLISYPSRGSINGGSEKNAERDWV